MMHPFERRVLSEGGFAYARDLRRKLDPHALVLVDGPCGLALRSARDGYAASCRVDIEHVRLVIVFPCDVALRAGGVGQAVGRNGVSVPHGLAVRRPGGGEVAQIPDGKAGGAARKHVRAEARGRIAEEYGFRHRRAAVEGAIAYRVHSGAEGDGGEHGIVRERVSAHGGEPLRKLNGLELGIVGEGVIAHLGNVRVDVHRLQPGAAGIGALADGGDGGGDGHCGQVRAHEGVGADGRKRRKARLTRVIGVSVNERGAVRRIKIAVHDLIDRAARGHRNGIDLRAPAEGVQAYPRQSVGQVQSLDIGAFIEREGADTRHARGEAHGQYLRSVGVPRGEGVGIVVVVHIARAGKREELVRCVVAPAERIAAGARFKGYHLERAGNSGKRDGGLSVGSPARGEGLAVPYLEIGSDALEAVGVERGL